MAEITSAADEKRQKLTQAYDELKTAFNAGTPIEIEIVEKTKGGFKTTFNDVPIFLPFAQYGTKKSVTDEEADAVIGQKLKVKIIEFTEDEFGKVLKISHRVLEEEEKWKYIVVGATVEATVTFIHSFGLAVDINGVDGFIHISQLSRNRVNDINDFAQKGDVLKAEIIGVDADKHRVQLSLKNAANVQFETFFTQHNVGERITGKIARITTNGLFVEIAPNVDGYLRMSEVSWTRRNVDLKALFEEGKEIETEIIELDKENSKIGLSYRKLQPDDWSEVADKYQMGVTYSAVIEFIPPNNKGVEISLDNQIDGFIPRMKMQALYNGNKPTFKRQDIIQVKLFNRDDERHSLVFESAIKPDNPNISDVDWDAKSSTGGARGNISKPDKVKNFTLADLLSSNSKNALIK
ncbi:MAG: S1 RNA-binding domain-containing protein [Ignavibacteria bacterium]|jgi:small subunit ribosomal protein S1|nr:S1 RNA-binding domain-containing protein [Ignavibacteria bacterium]